MYELRIVRVEECTTWKLDDMSRYLSVLGLGLGLRPPPSHSLGLGLGLGTICSALFSFYTFQCKTIGTVTSSLLVRSWHSQSLCFIITWQDEICHVCWLPLHLASVTLCVCVSVCLCVCVPVCLCLCVCRLSVCLSHQQNLSAR